MPAGDIEHVDHLAGISEELALALFDEVIRRGKLTPRVRTLNRRSPATGDFSAGHCVTILSDPGPSFTLPYVLTYPVFRAALYIADGRQCNGLHACLPP